MVTPSAGGIEHQIGEIADIRREYAMMTWGPEGRVLLLADRVSESRSEVALFQISVENGPRRQITFPPSGASDWMPAISPDGRRIGYARVIENGRGDVWAMPVNGGRPQRLTDTNEVFFCWTWNPDGGDLLISYRRSARAYLWRQPLSGGQATRVAGLDDQVKELSVARRGYLLIYGSSTEDDYNIWKFSLPPSTDPPRPLIASAAFDGGCKIFARRCARIAFASTRSGQSNIWTCSSDGSDLRQMTSLEHGGFTAGSPSWSPDGRWIAFDSRSAESASSIFLLDASGPAEAIDWARANGHRSQLVARWSLGLFQFGTEAVARGKSGQAPAVGGTPVQMTRNAGFESFESPDGRYSHGPTRREERLLANASRGRRRDLRPGLGGGCQPLLARLPGGHHLLRLHPKRRARLSCFTSPDGRVTGVKNLPAPACPRRPGIIRFLRMAGVSWICRRMSPRRI